MKHTLNRLCAGLLALMLCLNCLGPVSFAADEPYWGSSSDNGDGTFDNDACVDSDTPDPDIIRVGDAYYMTSTSMHFCPGVPIMKSYDLVNWKIVSYVYNVLDDYDQLAMRSGRYDYGKGSWATSLRYREYDKKFYLSHTCNTTNKTYFYRTDDIENGTWEQFSVCNTFYHDGSMLFDGEDIYMFSGSGTISVDKLKPDFSGSEWKKSIITGQMTSDVCGRNNTFLEATHAYKVGDTYYVFMCTWPSGAGKQQLVWKSKTVDGPYEGKVIIDDSYGRSEGLAQGGIVDMVDGSTQTAGKWMGFFMHLRGAAGRGLALTPCTFDAAGWPVVANSSGKAARSDRMAKPVAGEFALESVVESTDFDNGETRPAWTLQAPPKNAVEPERYAYNGSNLPMGFEWNHMPDNRLWSLTEREGYLRLTNGPTAKSVTDCLNVLTARTFGPQCWGSVAMEIDGMRDGDIAGFGAFHRSYGYLAVRVDGDKKYIVYRQRDGDSQDASFSNSDPWIESVMCELDPGVSRVWFKTWFDYRTYRNEYAHFYYSVDGETWIDSGKARKVEFGYPTHFDGCRFGIFNFATKQGGGCADFDYFALGDVEPRDVADPTERLASAIKRGDKLAEEDYSAATWAVFAEALALAKAAYTNSAATQQTLDAAYAALKDAMAGLQTNPRKILEARIAEAEALQEENYTAESWDEFVDARTGATTVYINSDATEEDCADAAEDLKLAMDKLVYRDAPVDEYFADGGFDAEKWTVLREDKEAYSVEPGKGLVLPTQRYDIYGSGHDPWKNLFTIPAKGDWEAVAKVVYPRTPTQNYQQAMMVVWQDEDNYIRMNCQQSNLKLEPGKETDGSFSGDGFQQPNASASSDGSVTLYFRIGKQGTAYTVGYSQDGVRFTTLGTANADYESPCIGFTATANTDDGAADPIDTYVEYLYLTKCAGRPDATYEEMRTWAAENVARYVCNALPRATDSDLPALPAAPKGYSVELRSSNPGVIANDGTVTQGNTEQYVTLTVTATENGISATHQKTVTVPAKGGALVDRSALAKVLEALEGMNPDDYTEQTAAPYREALAAARAVMEDAAATQQDVDAALRTLEEAFHALEPKPVEPPLQFRFDDVRDEGKFYFDPVYWAYYAEPQITNGLTATTFGPDAGCTRAQVVTFLWRAAGCPTISLNIPEGEDSPMPFTDVDGSSYYFNAVLWAKLTHITEGTTATTFSPNATCTRGQIVTFLWRFKASPAPKSTDTPFTDLKPNGFYKDAVAWAVENEITNGMTPTTFGPDATCTRGQVVTFLQRATGA